MPDRDRFVLLAGHVSMLLYALLHLAGGKELKRYHRGFATPRFGNGSVGGQASLMPISLAPSMMTQHI